MAKEIKTLIIDFEVSDEGSYEPGQSPPLHSEEEFLSILEAGCAVKGCSVAEIKPNTALSQSYSEVLYEVVEL